MTDINAQIKDLEQDIYYLECSDDALFSNANGNLPRWRSMNKELKELKAQLEDGK